jgi:hypothetical protein
MTHAAPPAPTPSTGSPAANGRPAVTAPHAAVASIGALRAPGLPSAAALSLARAPRRELERAMLRGAAPELAALVDWEFRGINATPDGAPPLARLAGIQKFVKGMFRATGPRDGDRDSVMGYNSPVVQNALDGRWQTRPSDAEPRRFGFYTVAPADPTRRDNRYLHALLLDYGQGGNPAWDPSRALRDYLVQVDADNPDLLLGKAYAAIGPLRIPVGYFVLERWRRAPTELADISALEALTAEVDGGK